MDGVKVFFGTMTLLVVIWQRVMLLFQGRYHLIDLKRGSFRKLFTKSSNKVLTKRLTLRGRPSGDGEVWRSHSSADKSLGVHKIMPGHILT